MLVQALAFVVILGVATASTIYMEDADIPVNSTIGDKLLSKARRLNQNDDYIDFSWALGYSVKFERCHTIQQFRADRSGDEEEGQNSSPYESQRWVKFRLCPSDSCDWCRKSGVYLVAMRDFLEAFVNFQASEREYECEQMKYECGCNNNDDNYCFSQCYTNAGKDYCAEFDSAGDDYNNDDAFELEEYMECRELADNDDDYNMLYVGPTCSKNGKKVFLGAFKDRDCVTKAASGTYKRLTGRELPYTTTSLVNNKCISCIEPSYNDDNYYSYVSEYCDELYDRSAKCEKNLQGVYPKMNGGCDTINKHLPLAERMTHGSLQQATLFSWLFFFTTSIISLYAFLLYRRLKRTQVSLSSQGYGEETLGESKGFN
mmetsp:Transcript_21100/g.23453  ORF Transcript_21100/g.23453 Transcript_21100/m.23453 type:complete len:373 (+) Transcript_21100:40-1158(+)|eukprot:CAMPEP_0194166286 /NCGR_PEP_ID=MMETSP0154-20130528/1936_1 /TAXON_ID=1049557 /ORGANISM="Thalassiothrix antarctica, Strain L6-D1" /LENGTH=372 /DNA_ID=CAMNT_0038876905 /DNA_START=40 /DNA_END=1158 /DNA_ORIENTATION=+